jgi:hypothetical protein
MGKDSCKKTVLKLAYDSGEVMLKYFDTTE